MQQKLLFSLAVAMCVTACPSRGSVPSATQPASAQAAEALGSIKGTVSVSKGLDPAAIDLQRVVVWLAADASLNAPVPAPASATVAQKDKAFIPNFLAIAEGTTVEFPNWDHIAHNVFSRSAAAPAFDLDRYPFGQSKTRIFDKVGVVQVFCNIHPSMHAVIVVTPNRFFAVADAQGNFQIDGVPPGHYQICAWQERCGTQSQPVDVVASNVTPLVISLSENRQNILANSPSMRIRYGVDRGLGIKRERLGLPVVTESHPAPATEPCPQCN